MLELASGSSFGFTIIRKNLNWEFSAILVQFSVEQADSQNSGPT